MNTSKLKNTLKRVAAADRPELADLEYLLQVQAGLERPLTPEVIKGLMHLRSPV